jgi:hypothetical protein
VTEAALNKSAPTVDDDHRARTEAFAHEVEIGFRKVFRLPDPTDGQRLSPLLKSFISTCLELGWISGLVLFGESGGNLGDNFCHLTSFREHAPHCDRR